MIGRVQRVRAGLGAALALSPRLDALETQVASLQAAVAENRRLNERLSDVLDVVVELLVPAVDRDEEKLQEALARLGNIT